MASLSELARQHSELSAEQRGHLWRLVGSWGLLADLSFADILLLVPVTKPGSGPASEAARFVAVGQIRPATAQTLYRDDQVGRFQSAKDRPMAAEAIATGQICTGQVTLRSVGRQASVQAVPVCCEDEVIAVMSIESPGLGSRESGELERTYSDVLDRMTQMIADGAFPFASDEQDAEQSPRVGDGLLVLDGGGRVTSTSPNAVSALHRIGFHADAIGRDLDDLGFQPGLLRTAYRLRIAITEEVERGLSVSILARVVPLIRNNTIDGALVLLRDVSDVRRQERLVVSMDATIREIHHRVKNNLQTVSSLLRLQGRRMEHPEARAAIDESVRRIHSIALVHEILAQDGGDDVGFGDIMRPIVQMVQESLISPDCPISFKIIGEGPTLPATTASSIAVVLTELLQNAVEHGYPDDIGGEIVIELEYSDSAMTVRIYDDGVGLPEGFDLATSGGLGLTIAKTLAAGDLQGEIVMKPADPNNRGAGTIAELTSRFQTGSTA